MSALFTSSGFTQSGSVTTYSGNVVNVQAWPPFLRVLLTTDGTVTKSLEAFFWEEVAVVALAQRVADLYKDEPAIGRRAGDGVLYRQVQLCGRVSQRCYAEAESLILPQCLPEPLRDALESGNMGIGEILRESGLETYREILDLGEACGIVAGAEQRYVWRLYRILMKSTPVMQITERFPLAVYTG